MLCSIICSAKILTLAIVPFLSTLVGVLCEFAMVPDVCILLSSQEEEVQYSSWGHRYTQSTAYSSKKLKPLLTSITMPRLLLNSELKKNIKKEFSYMMVFLIRPRSTFKFEFVFGWNECLWAIFSLLSFENF